MLKKQCMFAVRVLLPVPPPCPPTIHMWKLHPGCDGVSRRGRWGVPGLEGDASRMGLVTLQKRPTGRAPSAGRAGKALGMNVAAAPRHKATAPGPDLGLSASGA